MIPKNFDRLRTQVYYEHEEPLKSGDIVRIDQHSEFYVLPGEPVAEGGFAIVTQHQPHLYRDTPLYGGQTHLTGLPELCSFFVRVDRRKSPRTFSLMLELLARIPQPRILGLIAPELARMATRYYGGGHVQQVGPAIEVAKAKRAYHLITLGNPNV